MKKMFMLAVASLFLTGCASFVIKDGKGNVIEEGSAGGMGRDLVHTKTTVTVTTMVEGQPVTQTTTTESISSTSNVASALSAVTGLASVLIGGAEKAWGGK
jgi:hypothetical protein